MTTPLTSGQPTDTRRRPDFVSWWAERQAASRFEVTPIPFDALDNWYFDPDDGNLRHRSGRFFVVEGLRHGPRGTNGQTQPVLHQPEVGILGFLIRTTGAGQQVLIQAKAEPGNINGLQISPTVQATRSNYMRVHRGAYTHYLEHFRADTRRRALVDSLQSEQGAWFFRKRNRNIVVEAAPETPALDGFHWLDLAELRHLMTGENLVGMDARSIVACMTFLRPQPSSGDDTFTRALKASYRAQGPLTGALHSMTDILSWFTEAKAAVELDARLIPLREVRHWTKTPDEIADDTASSFRIMAVDVVATGREIPAWSQPVLAPCEQGLAAFLVHPINGVLHVLVQTLAQQGLRDVLELAPTVQRPGGEGPYLDEALTDDAVLVRFDTVMSEEGGRFYHAQTRYRVVETGPGFPVEPSPTHRWLTIRQLMDLVTHGHYVNVEARSLLACLHSLW
jgi:oxidase EvaA